MPFLRGTEFPTAVWAGEGTTIPLSGASLEPLSIRSKKLGTIIIQTREFLTAAARGDVRQQAQFTAELGRIINQLVAETFLDHTNAGDDATPAGLGYGLPVLPGSADAVDDVAALAESFGGDLTRAVLVMHPMLAVRAGEKFNSMCGARGGDAGGIPVVTSTAAPLTSDGGIIHLIDPSGVAAIEEGFTLDAATSTNLEVPDSNLGYFGLFQTDTIALRAMRFMNWMRALESSVAVMGVNW